MCTIIVQDMVYIFWFMKKADGKVTLLYPSPSHLVGCNVAVIGWLEYAPIETNIVGLRITPWSIIEIYPNTCSLSIPRIWSKVAGNRLSALSSIRYYLTRTNVWLTINNITQYGWMKGDYLTGVYVLQAGIDPSHHGSKSVVAPEWPSMS